MAALFHPVMLAHYLLLGAGVARVVRTIPPPALQLEPFCRVQGCFGLRVPGYCYEERPSYAKDVWICELVALLLGWCAFSVLTVLCASPCADDAPIGTVLDRVFALWLKHKPWVVAWAGLNALLITLLGDNAAFPLIVVVYVFVPLASGVAALVLANAHARHVVLRAAHPAMLVQYLWLGAGVAWLVAAEPADSWQDFDRCPAEHLCGLELDTPCSVYVSGPGAATWTIAVVAFSTWGGLFLGANALVACRRGLDGLAHLWARNVYGLMLWVFAVSWGVLAAWETGRTATALLGFFAGPAAATLALAACAQ